MTGEQQRRGRAQECFRAYVALHDSAPDPDTWIDAQEPSVRDELRQIFDDYLALRAGDGPTRRQLGDFALLRELGAGASGVVWEAEQRAVGRRVALKVLHAHYALSERVLERFRREAIAGGKLRHPGLATVYGAGEHEGTHFIVQELIGSGRSLADWIAEQQHGPAAERIERAVELVAAVAEALHTAHEAGVVHRDVKPLNILLDDRGRPVVADFGLASLQDDRSLSSTGDLIGTPHYMSPEQTDGRHRELDRRTDVFALGAVLYEALTLRRPFEGTSRDAVLQAIRRRSPSDPRRLAPEVSRELAAVCLRALEKERTLRYPSMAALAADLRAVQRGERPAARPGHALAALATWVRRRRRRLLAAAVLVSAAALLATGLGAWRHRERQRLERGEYLREIARADAAILQRDARAALQALAACPTGQRGLEWDLLRHRADSSSARWPVAGGRYACAIAPGPAPHQVTTGIEGGARVVDVTSGATVRELRDGLGHVHTLSVGGGGHRLLTGSDRGELRLWDLDRGAVLLRLENAVGWPGRVAFTPGGERFAATRGDAVVLRRGASAEPVATLRASGGEAVTCVAFSADGRRLALGTDDGGVELWDPVRGERQRRFADHDGTVWAVAFDPTDGDRLASAGDDRVVRVRDIERGRTVAVLRGHLDAVYDVAFAPAGDRLATCSEDGTVRLWNVVTGEPIEVRRGHGEWVGGVVFAADGRWLASRSGDATLRLWSGEAEQRTLALTPTPRLSVSAPDLRHVLVEQNGATLLELGPRTEGIRLPDLTGVRDAAVRGRRAWCAGADGALRTWIDGHPHSRLGAVERLAVDGPGRRVATAEGRRLRLCSAGDLSVQAELEVTAPVTALTWDDRSGQVLFGTEAGELTRWDGRGAARPIATLASAVTAVATDPAGRAAAGTAQGRLWVAAGAATELHQRVTGLAFSPDGLRLLALCEATGGRDAVATLRIVEPATGRELLGLRTPANHVLRLHLAADRRHLVADRLGSPVLWNLSRAAAVEDVR